MGKNKEKSFIQKNISPLVSANDILLAILGGFAAGISIAGILGSETAKQVAKNVGDSVKDLSENIQSAVKNNESPGHTVESKSRRTSPALDKDKV